MKSIDKSLMEICFNFTCAVKQAEELENLAAQIKSLSEKELENTVNRMNRAWDGDDAQSYIKKIRNLQSDLGKRAGQIQKGAAALRKAAESTYRAEREAYRIAQLRKEG